MRPLRERLLIGVIPALPAAFAVTIPAAALEPYQTVRSMQLVQDRIADGDHAAMPMQSRVLGLADQSMREAASTLFEDDRNFEALLVYGLSGGNPVTVDVVLARLKLTDEQKQMGDAVSQYLRGNFGGAAAGLQKIEIAKAAAGARPFLSLIKGSLLARDQPAQALQLFDFARLEAPGTLVEEAALRRSMPSAVAVKDSNRFLQLASQYARRFLRSPYATQFADEFVKGIISLYGAIDMKQVEDVLGDMTPAHRKVVYLRLARIGAIDGLRELSEFAASRAAEYGGEPGNASDARAQLYANLTSVASDKAEGVLETLRKIDREKLNPADQQLLDAAISVASVVIEPSPAPEVPGTGKLAPEDKLPQAVPPQAPATPAHTEPAKPAQSVPAAPATQPPAVQANSGTAAAPKPADQANGAAAVDQASTVVADAKRKLDEIDKLLADDQ